MNTWRQETLSNIRRPLLVRGIRLRVSNASLLFDSSCQLYGQQISHLGFCGPMVLGPGNQADRPQGLPGSGFLVLPGVMKIHEINEKSMKINENPWKSKKIDEKSMKINETRRKSMKIHENLWKFMKINENQRKSMKITENQRKSKKINENVWKPMKIFENQ